MLATHVTHKQLISRICREFTYTDKKNTNNLIEKYSKNTIRQFAEESQMAHKRM